MHFTLCSSGYPSRGKSNDNHFLSFLGTGCGEPVLIAHNYGHGGAGYQASWGTAYEVLKRVEEAEKEFPLPSVVIARL